MTTSHRRLLQLFAFLAAWALVVVARLVQVQIAQHDHYVVRAQRQQEQTLALDPVRGSIVDIRGRVLAESVAAESLYADPQVIGDPAAVAKQLGAIPALGVRASELEKRLRAGGGFVWIARQLPMDVADRVRKLQIAGLGFIEAHRRSYPRAGLAASVVGFVGVDGGGLAGIEHSLDGFVHGRAGRVTLLRDARHGVYLVGGEGPNRPIDGDEVFLTVDSVVQFITERALSDAVAKYRAAGGSAIVMDPTDGSILAMASVPTFDPNRFRDFSPIAWRNRNVQEMYEPGSTFKIVTASAGLEEGVVTPSQILDCGNGSIEIGGVAIHEHGHNAYGLIPFEEVMVHSSNVGAVRVGLALGQSRFYRWIRRFGFGDRTGIPLPGETGGLLRSVDHWSELSNASMSFGQEIGVTPLQLIGAAATVANGGVRVEPRIIDRVIDTRGNITWHPARPQPVRVMSEKTAAVMNEILKSVVARGTGQEAAMSEHIVAGKTGTSQKADRGGYSPNKFVASFVGYVPADRPRLVILVVVDEPKESQYGGQIAAPAFRQIAESTLRYLGVAPSIPARTLDPAEPVLATISQDWKGRPESAGVPDFRGLDARAAIARAVAAGLTVRVGGSGVVISQLPGPGGVLPQDHRVTLMLSGGQTL